MEVSHQCSILCIKCNSLTNSTNTSHRNGTESDKKTRDEERDPTADFEHLNERAKNDEDVTNTLRPKTTETIREDLSWDGHEGVACGDGGGNGSDASSRRGGERERELTDKNGGNHETLDVGVGVSDIVQEDGDGEEAWK